MKNNSNRKFFSIFLKPDIHCVKSVQVRSFFWSVFSRIRTEYGEVLRENAGNAGKYGPKITPCLDTFHAVIAN